MDQGQIIERIRANRPRLAELGVSALWLFGSVARGDAPEARDIDLLVRFEGRATFDRYMDLKLFLEDLLRCRVDLVTEHALRKEVRAKVEREMFGIM